MIIIVYSFLLLPHSPTTVQRTDSVLLSVVTAGRDQCEEFRGGVFCLLEVALDFISGRKSYSVACSLCN